MKNLEKIVAETEEQIKWFELGEEVGKEKARREILRKLSREYNGENNPMLNEYTRGYNSCLKEIKEIINETK